MPADGSFRETERTQTWENVTVEEIGEEIAGRAGVASAIQSTWTSVSAQIKTVVNGVVFPALDVILVVALFCKFAMAFFDYRKHGQFEWTGIAILFACLVFTLSAPNYIWGIVGL